MSALLDRLNQRKQRIHGYVPLALIAALGLLACESGSKNQTETVSAESEESKAARHAEEAAQAARKQAAEKEQAKQQDAIPAPEDVAKPPEDAVKTDSGLVSKVLSKGTGEEHPDEDARVTVHYTGWTTSGEMFDSSVARGKPASFAVKGVIPGWTEGLQLMVEGEKRRLWIPADLAYGDKPRRPGAPAGDLVFDVELIDIQSAPEAPENLKKPPQSAKKTDSGLAYLVLEEGEGTKHPGKTDRVSVEYSGWTTDGKMFDSTFNRGRPATFALNRVIPGWTEGVQLMVEGEKTRFWIPADLAYGEKPKRPGAPFGDLVFDVRLVEIHDDQR